MSQHAFVYRFPALNDMEFFGRQHPSGADGALDVLAPTLSDPEVFRHGREENLTTKEVTVHLKPSFYIGSVPFSYTTYTMDMLGGGASYFRSNIIILHDFGQWKNLYVYDDTGLKLSGVAEGAVTIDKNGERIAVAKLSKLIKGEGVEIEEYHLNSRGGVMFYCKSYYSFGSGLKENEAYAKGKKTAEYYLYWPVSSQE